MKTFAAFRTEDALSNKVREVVLRGKEFSGDGMELTIANAGRVLHTWQLPRGIDSKKLKGAIELAALQYYWEHPGKSLTNGRPNYDAYQVLTYLYHDMVDAHLVDWMETNSYEYEFEAECAVGKHVLPVLVTAICDGPWFRLTTRFKLHNDIKHQSDDLTLTRDYSSGMTTTLAELLAKLGNDNAALITAACKVNAPEPAPYDYTGIANKTFGYVKKP